MKKTTRRQQTKNPNLDNSLNLRNRKEYIDFDYLDKLSPQDLAYLDKFTNENYGAAFEESGNIQFDAKAEIKVLRKIAKAVKKLINPSRTKETEIKQDLERLTSLIEQYDNITEYKKDAENRNNSRNRCVYSRAKASNMLKDIDDLNKKSLKTKDELENELSDKIGVLKR